MLVAMGDMTYRVSNMDPFELYCLAAIARIRRPRTIFEVGTYDGATTLWWRRQRLRRRYSPWTSRRTSGQSGSR